MACMYGWLLGCCLISGQIKRKHWYLVHFLDLSVLFGAPLFDSIEANSLACTTFFRNILARKTPHDFTTFPNSSGAAQWSPF